jgi:Predicted membrane protein (DUF2157)
MTIQEYLERWNVTGTITPVQFQQLSALGRGDRFSLFAELHILLYLGVIAVAAGVGLTIRAYSTGLGDVAILAALTLLVAASLYYCFSHALPYSNDKVETHGFAFDYVLYLACLLFAAEIGYVEFRFHLLGERWYDYLLASSVVYFALAYRFDNRLVLSLALSTLAGFFGLRLSYFSFGDSALRVSAVGYGVSVAAVGVVLQRLGIKKHFLEAYLHVAANVLFVALLSGTFDQSWRLYLLALIALAAAAVAAGVRFRRFVFVVYGVLYGYVGITPRLLELLGVNAFEGVLAYLVLTGTMVIAGLAIVARQFGREE